jgi:hypothetical protein
LFYFSFLFFKVLIVWTADSMTATDYAMIKAFFNDSSLNDGNSFAVTCTPPIGGTMIQNTFYSMRKLK